MVVDHQVHWYPRAGFELLVGRDAAPRAERDGDGYVAEIVPGLRVPFPARMVDLDSHFEDMNAHGIDAIVSSPAVWLGDAALYEDALALELFLLLNDEAARAQREHPERFVGLAVLPLRDTESALAVLDEAARSGLRGVCVHANVGGAPIVTDELMPVYRRMDELGMTLALHPTIDTAMAAQYRPYGQTLERVTWFMDTSAAALALICGGVLDECPNLTVIHPHVGGVLPYLRGRMAALADAGLEQPLDEYFRTRFYTDTMTETPGALGLAAELYGPERILLGTDYPYFPREPMLAIARAEHPAAFEATMPSLTGPLVVPSV